MKKNQGSESLFRLVQSLDANERGYVKKFLKRHSQKRNVYLDLVEALEKQSEYDETALKKQFKNLAVAKVQAWDEIMNALCIYNKNISLTFESFNASMQIAILLNKGLKTEAQKLSDSFIKQSYEVEDFYGLINLLSISGNLIDERKAGKPIAVWSDEYMAEIIAAIDKLKESYEYAKETMRLSYLHLSPKDENYIAKINAFKKDNFIFDKKPSSDLATRYYYDAYALYYASVDDHWNHIKYLEKSNELVNKRMLRLHYYDEHFLYSNMVLVAAYYMVELYDKAQKQLNFIQNFPIKSKTFQARRDADAQYMQLSLFNRSKQLKELKLYVEKNEKSIINSAKNYRIVYVSNHFKICYLISLLLLEKHTEALRWILECDNDKTFRTNDLNYQLVLVIEIVLNYGLKDYETAEKIAKKHARNKGFQLSNLLAALSIFDKKKRNIALYEAIQNTTEKSNLLLEYFDVFEWMKTVWK